MIDILAADEIYATEYRRYVDGMAFAGEPGILAFDAARASLERLCGPLLG
jgi:hypothetical protein